MHAPDFLCDLEVVTSLSLDLSILTRKKVDGYFTPEWVGGTVFSLPTAPRGPETQVFYLRGGMAAGGQGGSSLSGTLTSAQRPRPALDSWPKDAAAPGAGLAGDSRADWVQP